MRTYYLVESTDNDPNLEREEFFLIRATLNGEEVRIYVPKYLSPLIESLGLNAAGSARLALNSAIQRLFNPRV